MELPTHELEGGTLVTTAPNPAYEIMKHKRKKDGQSIHEYELVDMSPGIDPPTAKAVDKIYEIPSPTSRLPLSTIPLSKAPSTSGDMCVAKNTQEKAVHNNIPGDQ